MFFFFFFCPDLNFLQLLLSCNFKTNKGPSPYKKRKLLKLNLTCFEDHTGKSLYVHVSDLRTQDLFKITLTKFVAGFWTNNVF